MFYINSLNVMFFETKKYPQDYLTDKTYLAGVLTGVVGSLAIGLLLVPRLGKELRNQLSGVVDDQADAAKSTWGKAKSEVKETVDHAKANAGRVADRAEGKAKELADDAKSGFDKLKDAVRLA